MSDRDSSVRLLNRAADDRPCRGNTQDVDAALKLVNFNQINKSTSIHLVVVYNIVLLLTVMNFFLTKHPYNSIHNSYGFGDDFFFVNSTRIIGVMLLAYCCLAIVKYKSRTDPKIIILCIICAISGILTWRIETKFFTYVLIVVSLVGTSAMARHDGLLSSERSRMIQFLSLSSLSVWMLGFATMVLLPETSGVLYFAFSRDSRSEITLWHMAALYAVFPCLCVVNVLKSSRLLKLFWILLYLIHVVFVVLTARRVWIMQATIPVVLAVAFSRSSLPRFVTIVTMGGGLLAAFYCGLFDKFMEIFFLSTSGNQISLEDASNGRASLWEYHIECFLRSPIWGNGVYVIDYNRDKESLGFLQAESEIGVMSVFSEFGAVFGLALVAISLVALFRALGIMKSAVISKGDALVCFLAFYYVTNYFFFIIETNSIVTGVESFVFWYAMMFFFYRRSRRALSTRL